MGETIGFIGLGAMGAPMARRLLGAGHTVIACDANPAALDAMVASGAQAATSARALADQVETIMVSLPTPAVVQAVAAEVAEGSKAKLFIDLSTTGPRVAQDVGAMLNKKGLEMLDSPVSGGVGGEIGRAHV